jgi:hypothetical protein
VQYHLEAALSSAVLSRSSTGYLFYLLDAVSLPVIQESLASLGEVDVSRPYHELLVVALEKRTKPHHKSK